MRDYKAEREAIEHLDTQAQEFRRSERTTAGHIFNHPKDQPQWGMAENIARLDLIHESRRPFLSILSVIRRRRARLECAK